MEKRMRTEGVDGEIVLPEAIIQHVQSFLTGKEAAQTTAISKSWYSAWLTRPNLDLDQRDYGIRSCGFYALAKRIVQRYQELNLKIESCRLFINDHSFGNELIVTAMKMGAFDLHFETQFSTMVLPHEVLGSENLLRLSVTGCKIDGKVLQEFCSLLSEIFEEKNIEFIDPLCWKSRAESVTKGKSISPSNAKKFDKVLIGVLEHDHFFSIHVHMNEHQIFIMDSMVGTHESYEKHLTNLVEYMFYHYKISKEHWEFYLVHNSPQQGNEVDCGVFMLKNMEYWAKGEKLPFTRTQAIAARHILMLEVVNGGLIAGVKAILRNKINYMF